MKRRVRATRSQPFDRFGDMGGPFPPTHPYEAVFPMMPGPSPLIAGHGDTPEEAVADLKAKAEADPLARCWLDLVDWAAA